MSIVTIYCLEQNDVEYLILMNSQFKERNYYKDLYQKLKTYSQKNTTIMLRNFGLMSIKLHSFIKEIQNEQLVNNPDLRKFRLVYMQ